MAVGSRRPCVWAWAIANHARSCTIHVGSAIYSFRNPMHHFVLSATQAKRAVGASGQIEKLPVCKTESLRILGSTISRLHPRGVECKQSRHGKSLQFPHRLIRQ